MQIHNKLKVYIAANKLTQKSTSNQATTNQSNGTWA